MPFGLLIGLVLLLFPHSLLAAGAKPVVQTSQSISLKSTSNKNIQLKQKSPKIQLQQKAPQQQQVLPYRESEWEAQRRAIEQSLLSRECEDQQRGCLNNFVSEGHWDLLRSDVEACAVRLNPACRDFPLRRVYITVWPAMQPPIEMLPGRNALINGAIDLHFECRQDWERCSIIYFYDYDDPERLTSIIRLEPNNTGELEPLDPLPDEHQEAERHDNAPANNCYHPSMVTDYGAVTLDDVTLAQISLYGSIHGCYLPDRNGCYQEVSSDQPTALRQCPGDFIYQGRDARYAIPCQYKFDRYQFAFAFGLPDDAMFCYLHFLRPRRLN